MQILAISKPQNVEEARLLHNHRELRARIFSDRLAGTFTLSTVGRQTPLPPNANLHPRNFQQRGSGSCARLLPTIGPSMITDVFPSLLRMGSSTRTPR